MRTLHILLFIILIAACGSVPLYQAIRTDATLTGAGTTDSPLGVNRGTELTPASITTDKDDFDPTGWDAASYVRLDGDNGIRAITSMAAPDASTSPQEKTLINIGSYPLYFPGEHPDGTAANRIITDRDFILYPKQSCKIVYDNTSTRWRIVGQENRHTNTLLYSIAPGSVTAGDWGYITPVAFNSGSISSANSTTSLPAAFTLATATSTTGAAEIVMSESPITSTSAFASAHQWIEASVSLPTLSDGTETYTCELQITNNTGSVSLEPNNTVALRYSHSINSGEWELFSQDNAGAESVADCGVVVATNTLYLIRVEIDKSKTEARAYINGNFVGRVTGNLPNSLTSNWRVIMMKSAGTTARTLNVHNFSAGAIYP